MPGPPAGSAAALIFRALRELHLQANAAHALLAQLVHHLQYRFIARVLVPADEHRELRVLATHFLDRLRKLRARYGALADDRACRVAGAHDQAAVSLDEHFQRHDARLAGLVDRRQVDHGRRDERRGDHEDHKEHEHHVDVRHDVDLVHRPALADGRHCYRPAWRCRMLENSSMKLSKRLASRSTSCE